MLRSQERIGKGLLAPPGDKATPRPLAIGSRVMARWQGLPKAARYPAVVVAIVGNGRVRIKYDEACLETGKQEEELAVLVEGRRDPVIMHEDGTYVCGMMPVRMERSAAAPEVEDAEAPRKHHMGFTRMVMAPEGDDLADRMQFPFRFAEANESGKMVQGPVQHVSLKSMMTEQDKAVAEAHHKALFDWFVQLYTTPPTSFETMHHLLGKEDPAGPWDAAEKKRVKDVFKVHAAAKREADKRRAKAKGVVGMQKKSKPKRQHRKQ